MEGLGLVDNLEVGRLPIETARVVAKRIDRPDADVVLLVCTNWKSMTVVVALEDELGKPVVSTTQATLWAALRLIGVTDPVLGYGHLLKADLAPSMVDG